MAKLKVVEATGDTIKAVHEDLSAVFRAALEHSADIVYICGGEFLSTGPHGPVPSPRHPDSLVGPVLESHVGTILFDRLAEVNEQLDFAERIRMSIITSTLRKTTLQSCGNQ